MDQDYDLGPTKVQTDVSYNSSDHNYMFENEKTDIKFMTQKQEIKRILRFCVPLPLKDII